MVCCSDGTMGGWTGRRARSDFVSLGSWVATWYGSQIDALVPTSSPTSAAQEFHTSSKIFILIYCILHIVFSAPQSHICIYFVQDKNYGNQKKVTYALPGVYNSAV